MGAVADDDIHVLRRKLAARRDDCWARLEDAVSELQALHSVAADEIVARVRATIEGEREPVDPRPSRLEPLDP